MINKEDLKEICKEYEIDVETLVQNNANILEYGEVEDIREVLKFLKGELNIDGKNIEKCPSIFYRKPGNVKYNWSFLKAKNIKTENVESCLHILSTESNELQETYDYVVSNYGERYLNKITSILGVSVERIQDLETKLASEERQTILQAAISRASSDECVEIIRACRDNGIEITGTVFFRTGQEIRDIAQVCRDTGIEITGNVFRRTVGEIRDIAQVCRDTGIEITGTVFQRTAGEIRDIAQVCRDNGIEITGTVFKRTAGEIRDIAQACRDTGIEVTGTVFQRTAGEIRDIAQVCRDNGIEITGSIFIRTTDQLRDNIRYVKDTFGKEYLQPLIISKNKKCLEKVLPFLKTKGVLPVIVTSASILALTKEEIEERMDYLQRYGEQVVVSTKEGQKFNSLFGFSRKKYKKLLEKEGALHDENGER